MTKELALIINLHNVSKWHGINCQDDSCNVMLHQIREAAQYISKFISPNEFDEAQKFINRMY